MILLLLIAERIAPYCNKPENNFASLTPVA
jgi:hypothetical protein